MGLGKTTYMIDYLNQVQSSVVAQGFDDEEPCPSRFIYVAPLLTEVERVTDRCPALGFSNPVPVEGKKLSHLESLIGKGENICTTHALFKLMTQDMCQKIKDHGYTLVIDEALECVALFEDLSASDRQLLIDKGMIHVEAETGRLGWNNKDHGDYRGKFDHLKRLCDNGNLVLVSGKVLIWEFPSEFISSFEDVFILTYLFRGSPMASYLEAEGLEYELRTLKDKRLVAYDDNRHEIAIKERLRGLITVYDGSLNDAGKRLGRSHPFSVQWIQDKAEAGELEGLRSTVEYFFKSIARTPSDDNAWTIYASFKGSLKGKRYTKGFIACNAKATNDFRHKKSLAYLCNRFHHPYIKAYFDQRGISIDQDAFALSEMLQWVWRSQIRDGEPITVFIPSGRMRKLFTDWLWDRPALGEGEQDNDNIEAVAA